MIAGCTEIILADKRILTVEAIAELIETGEQVYGFGFLDGEVLVQEIEAVSRVDKLPLLSVLYENGKRDYVTRFQEFVNYQGGMVRAGDLCVGMTVRSIYRRSGTNNRIVMGISPVEAQMGYEIVGDTHRNLASASGALFSIM